MTFEQTLDAVMGLPFEQRAILLDIVRRRDAEQRREQLAQDAESALTEFRSGTLKALDVSEVVDLLSEFDDE